MRRMQTADIRCIRCIRFGRHKLDNKSISINKLEQV